ncbi:MAG: cobalamin-binding protein [Thermoprotei archaeon]|nr:MAG: cobalamin-binding protein [Thermoprotei archaeon]
MEIFNEIKKNMVELDDVKVKQLIEEALKKGVSPTEIVEKSLRPAMVEIGELFEKGEYFLAELVVAGDIFKEVMDELLLPALRKSGAEIEKLGTVVIGTVKGDLHDIGKSIVASMLRAAGFEVIDLGVDVSPEKFVEAVKKYNANIVGLSALLTTTMLEMKNVIEELKKAGLRDKVKVIVGGAPVTPEFAKEIGADAYARDAVEAVEVCKKLLKRK